MAKELAPGDRAPAFKLATDTDGEISSTGLKGSPYVLYFYPKDDTAGCTREAIDFSAAKKKFDALKVPVIAFSRDSVQSHEKFAAKHKLKIKLASDPDIETAKAFGIWIEKSL